MKLNFTKMQGCGNDFLIFDCLGEAKYSLDKDAIVTLCHRQVGVGADGVILLYPGKTTDVIWDFYNSDGSVAEMCGNGSRCATGYLLEKHFPDRETVTIQTLAGVLTGRRIDSRLVEVEMPGLDYSQLSYVEKTVSVGGDVLTLNFVNTGVPHSVIEVKDIASYPIQKVGRALVRHSIFPNGSNITFFQRLTPEHAILSTTFERGVEEETLACGTGATAAAYIYSEKYLQKFPIEVRVPGGNLTLSVNENKKVLLKGGFETIAEIEIEDFQSRTEVPKRYGKR